MPCEREHINRRALFHAITVAGEILEIARQRLRAARHIDHALRCELDNGREKCLVASGTRRVHNDHVCLLAFFRHLHHKLASILMEKAYIINIVSLSVRDCITNRVFI